ncbi:hypothetical protein J7643_02080 [bacterium]|nr:hypothetical protein [bacterium]
MRFKPIHAMLPLMALSLTGCFGASPAPIAVMPTEPMYGGMPVSIAVPAPELTNGPSLYDAHHQVQRYVTLHYGEARMVKAWSDQVGSVGRIGREGTWYFTYAVPYQPAATDSANPDEASPSFTAQGVDVPSRFETQYLTFALTGTNQLLAPESLSTTSEATFDFGRAIALSKALELCAQDGMSAGPNGLKVALRATSGGGAVYEIDNSLSYQNAYASPQPPVYRGKMPYPMPSATPYPNYAYDQPYYGGGYGPGRLGTFVVDAYTGKVLSRP